MKLRTVVRGGGDGERRPAVGRGGAPEERVGERSGDRRGRMVEQHGLLAELRQPGLDLVEEAAAEDLRDGQAEQARGLAAVADRQVALDRVRDVAAPLVPGGRALRQLGEARRSVVGDAAAQRLAQEGMQTEARALAIQGHDEGAVVAQAVEALAGPLGVEHGVAGRAGERVEHRRLAQEAPVAVVEGLQHLGVEVLGDVVVRAVDGGGRTPRPPRPRL